MVEFELDWIPLLLFLYFSPIFELLLTSDLLLFIYCSSHFRPTYYKPSWQRHPIFAFFQTAI